MYSTALSSGKNTDVPFHYSTVPEVCNEHTISFPLLHVAAFDYILARHLFHFKAVP